MKKRIVTVTQEGMTRSQPGMSVSVRSGEGRHVLCASRYYEQLGNEFGGKGRFKNCDCDGMEFESSDAAFAFAHQRGYLQPFYRKAWR